MSTLPRSFRCSFVCWGVVVFVAGGRVALGSPVTWDFQGVVETVDDYYDLLGGTVTPGSVISGTITFESTTPGDQLVHQLYADPFTSVGGHLEQFSFTGPISNRGSIYVLNDSFSNGQDALSFLIPISIASEDAFLSLGLTDPSGTLYDSTDLPLTPPDLSLFPTGLRQFSISRETEDLAIRGYLETLVPEPGTLLLLSIAIAGLVLRRRSTGHGQRSRHTHVGASERASGASCP